MDSQQEEHEGRLKPKKIKRKCLKCSKQFEAKGLYVRICRECKSHSTDYGVFDSAALNVSSSAWPS